MTHEGLKHALDSGAITPTVAQGLENLTPGSYCQHKSWGFGQVAEWRLETNQIVIDFESKKGHLMQPAYAVESLTVIPQDDIRARVRHSAEAVRQEAENNPVGLVRSILANLGGKATADKIIAPLTPHIFDQAKTRRWWEAAKKKLKTDGHFHLPTKKTDPVELLGEPVAAHTALLGKFRAARHLSEQTAALDALLKSVEDLAANEAELRELVSQIEDAATKGRRLQPAKALELLLARDEIIAAHPEIFPAAHSPSVADILREETSRLADLFAQLPAAKQKAALESLEAAFNTAWTDKAFSLMRQSSPRLVADIHRLFQRKKLGELMRVQLNRWITERSASSELLYWLSKERGASYPELFNPALFGAVLTALELDQLSETKKSMRLRDLIIDDSSLLGEFFAKAPREDVRDAMRRLLLTTVFDDLNKRSLIGRMIKLHPDLQSMVSGEAEQTAETLTVSWASLERRKKELDDLINRQIPQNVKDISIARSYGDLRENFEFKSAKEQQAVLARRKAELERDLARARGTNFENPDTSTVAIGTTVTIADASEDKTEDYSILGAWDSAPELGIVSYKAGIGQALLGHGLGETVSIGGGRNVRITAIAPFKNLDLLVRIHQVASSQESVA